MAKKEKISLRDFAEPFIGFGIKQNNWAERYLQTVERAGIDRDDIPRTIKSMAVLFGIPSERADAGEFTYGELDLLVDAWAAKQRMAGKRDGDKTTVSAAAESCSKTDGAVRGQADTKADNEKTFQIFVPENRDVVKLDKLIKSKSKAGRPKTETAREFTEYDEKKSSSLLRQIRLHRLHLDHINPIPS